MPSESFAIARGKELGPGARLGLSENRPSLGARSSGITQKVVAKVYATAQSDALFLRKKMLRHFVAFVF
jgi:hypothetical protein